MDLHSLLDENLMGWVRAKKFKFEMFPFVFGRVLKTTKTKLILLRFSSVLYFFFLFFSLLAVLIFLGPAIEKKF